MSRPLLRVPRHGSRLRAGSVCPQLTAVTFSDPNGPWQGRDPPGGWLSNEFWASGGFGTSFPLMPGPACPRPIPFQIRSYSVMRPSTCLVKPNTQIPSLASSGSHYIPTTQFPKHTSDILLPACYPLPTTLARAAMTSWLDVSIIPPAPNHLGLSRHDLLVGCLQEASHPHSVSHVLCLQESATHTAAPAIFYKHKLTQVPVS